jgi:hypothetical protein
MLVGVFNITLIGEKNDAAARDGGELETEGR